MSDETEDWTGTVKDGLITDINDGDAEGLVYYDAYGNRCVCPGAGCNDGSCPGWG